MKIFQFHTFAKSGALLCFLGLSAFPAYAQTQQPVAPVLRPSSAPVAARAVFRNTDAVVVWQAGRSSGSSSNIEAAPLDISQGIGSPVTWAVNQLDAIGLSAYADGNIFVSWRSLDPFNFSNRINFMEISRNDLNRVLQQTTIPFPLLGATEILYGYSFIAEEGYSAAVEFITDFMLTTQTLRVMYKPHSSSVWSAPIDIITTSSPAMLYSTIGLDIKPINNVPFLLVHFRLSAPLQSSPPQLYETRLNMATGAAQTAVLDAQNVLEAATGFFSTVRPLATSDSAVSYLVNNGAGRQIYFSYNQNGVWQAPVLAAPTNQNGSLISSLDAALTGILTQQHSPAQDTVRVDYYSGTFLLQAGSPIPLAGIPATMDINKKILIQNGNVYNFIHYIYYDYGQRQSILEVPGIKNFLIPIPASRLPLDPRAAYFAELNIVTLP